MWVATICFLIGLEIGGVIGGIIILVKFDLWSPSAEIRAWRETPDELLKPWARKLRRWVGGGPK